MDTNNSAASSAKNVRRAYVIADMAKRGKQIAYTLVTLLLEYNPEATPTQYRWKLVNAVYCEPDQVYNKISADNKQAGNRAVKLINFKFNEKKEAVGDPASLSRFLVEAKDNDPRFKPWVALSKITTNGKTIGYVMLARDTKNGTLTLTKKKVEDIEAFGKKFTANDLIPIQNLRFMTETNSFAVYPHSELFEEPVNNNNIRNTRKVETPSKEKMAELDRKIALSKTYTPEQLEQLRLGKKNNVNIGIYKDPKLSAEQMKTLREGLQSKVDVRSLANPKINTDVMRYCIEDMKNGVDITKVKEVYNNIDNFSVEQIANLSLAYDMGLDVGKIADPSLTPNQMASIITAMDNSIWQDDGVDIIVEGVPFVVDDNNV